MKKFSLKIVKIIIVCFFVNGLLILILTLIKKDHYYDYPAALVSKYKSLEKKKKQRKVIIAGGSSSCYSLDSKSLSKEFNLPVINTSLAISLGSEFHLFHLKDYIKEGDVILYFPEYEFYYGNTTGDDFLSTSFFYYPKIIKDYSRQQKLIFLKNSFKLSVNGLKNYFLNSFLKPKSIDTLQYSRLAYNEYGDNTFLLNNKTSIFDRNNSNRYLKLRSKNIDKEYLNILKRFSNFCKDKRATFIVGFPPIAKSDFDTNFTKDALEIQRTTKINILGKSEQNVFPDSLFYDTSYHMNGLGRPLRTKQLLIDLKEANILK